MKATLGRLRAPSLPGTTGSTLNSITTGGGNSSSTTAATATTSSSSSRHLSSIPPPSTSTDYSPHLAALASQILYRSPIPSRGADLPVYILDAAAFPDSKVVDYDALLPYVLARLPAEDELIGGAGYEVVFFAGWSANGNHTGGGGGGIGGSREDVGAGKRSRSAVLASSVGGSGGVADAEEGTSGGGKDGVTGGLGDGGRTVVTPTAKKTGGKKSRPGWGWFLQAYHVLSRAMRKRLMKLYVVHEKGWIRILMEMFATVVSPKMRKKVVHVSSLTGLALQIPIEDLIIPPTAYMTDRQKVPHIFAPYASGKRAFGVPVPLPPLSTDKQRRRLPRVLREATSFLLMDDLLKTDGIFRISARAQTVEVLKEAFERAQKFIVWREAGTAVTFPHYVEGRGTVSIEDLEPLDGYDVHTAAALIKLWYHDLREPILPSSSYQALEKIHGGSNTLGQDQLLQLLSPDPDVFSPFPPTSRLILTSHLLPLLSRVADESASNRMAPSNLATVFAPNMVCGSDQIADLKMVGVIQRLLIALIENWKILAPSLGCTDESFEALLRLPDSVDDREDPLQEARRRTQSNTLTQHQQTNGVADQMTGISLEDNERIMEASDEDDEEDEEDEENTFLNDAGLRPPLPPRPGSVNASTENVSSLPTQMTDNPIRRKPAPAVSLPRYSTVFGSAPILPGSENSMVSDGSGGNKRRPLADHKDFKGDQAAAIAALNGNSATSGSTQGAAGIVAEERDSEHHSDDQEHRSHESDSEQLPTYAESLGGPYADLMAAQRVTLNTHARVPSSSTSTSGGPSAVVTTASTENHLHSPQHISTTTSSPTPPSAAPCSSTAAIIPSHSANTVPTTIQRKPVPGEKGQ